MISQKNIYTISDLRFKTKDVFKKILKEPVFIFNRSTPKGVILSIENYNRIINQIEDYYLSIEAEEYEKENKANWLTHEEVKKRLNV